jgi:succinate dehydrogenase subunit C
VPAACESTVMLGMTALLFIAQRATAAILAFAVTIHLATIVYAVRGGLTAAEILARTRHNGWFLALYAVFVLAVAIHAPIGLLNIAREWTNWRGRSLDLALAAFALLLVALGLTAAFALFLA